MHLKFWQCTRCNKILIIPYLMGSQVDIRDAHGAMIFPQTGYQQKCINIFCKLCHTDTMHFALLLPWNKIQEKVKKFGYQEFFEQL